ncbi:MAG: hypothetical protein IJ141_06830 [Lachnospiraceae bacterium]|nr:hypothetical protein [Lachnospiraceae bacterium]
MRTVIKQFRRFIAFALVFAVIASSSNFVFNKHSVVKAKELAHEKATEADVKVPTYNNKKGIQGTEIANGDYAEDLNEVSLNHMMLNVDLTQVLENGNTPYEYKGKTYYFNEAEGSMMKVWMDRVKSYREEADITWTFCLVFSWSDDPEIQKLMFNPEPGHVYYAFDSGNPEVRDEIAALLHYMAERFSYSDTFVENWRLGNEVNVAHNYNFTGAGTTASLPLTETLVDNAVTSYELIYEALKDENPYAKAYVSATHDWNNDNEGTGVPSQEFIVKFAEKVKYDDWNLDFHAYPPQMKEQVWTRLSAQYMRQDEETKFICAPNIDILTNFIKKNYGTNHRVMLSEQSYDSTYGETEQAAMIAYTYYAAARNDMIDSVIFTTWQDTNSVHHDFYNMGMITYEGQKKESYNVFKYMNTDQAATYVDPYLNKFTEWTGRPITSWADDILYKAPVTNVVLTEASLYYPPDEQQPNSIYVGLTTEPKKTEVDIEYMWTAYNHTTGETTAISGWCINGEWIRWFPSENATYTLTCTARIAGNTSSTMSASMDFDVNFEGKPYSKAPQQVGDFATYEGNTFTRDEMGNVTCKDANGNPVINDFKCDGTYTYYFQLDGTAMKDRLTYHPDGEHVIYFDENGHEVFSDFANVKKTIAGEAVDDFCFFNVYGYMYVDVITYDKTGTYLYYANPYGVMEMGKWFQFSDTVEWADGTPAEGIAGGYGYANANGTLLTNVQTFDWEGRSCYMQGNGVALY